MARTCGYASRGRSGGSDPRSSWGAARAGTEIAGGVDRDRIATAVFRDNFPDAAWVHEGPTEGAGADLLRRALGDVDLLMASPECMSHTHARGVRPPDDASRLDRLAVHRFLILYSRSRGGWAGVTPLGKGRGQ